jgi:hypothetical protein
MREICLSGSMSQREDGRRLHPRGRADRNIAAPADGARTCDGSRRSGLAMAAKHHPTCKGTGKGARHDRHLGIAISGQATGRGSINSKG